ncbi:hypothetical protein RSK20926_06737 [Roseobacter sp. SK209-2-6]|uniref:hypothetical protein n=1 Tax=Roseobacter sp. SK209-2-6 TaxID=388739 RepID=UPI0000F3D7BE|nr:hypothetical protein [Roseobacter sp. SK209-2-6]EBA17412.1 hypothetical protein RSK20926_06737 [Roseobacter sp. SK209-2-6]
MIEWYVTNYVVIAAGLFFLGPIVHFFTNCFKLDDDWQLGTFVSKGLATGTAAIIPPFFFVFKDKSILERIDGIEYYLAIAALVIFYFSVQALIPSSIQTSTNQRNRQSSNRKQT